MPRRGRLHRVRHRLARFRRHHKQGLISKAINAGGLLIGFNQELGQTLAEFKAGTLLGDPQRAFGNIGYKAIGLTSDGNIDTGQLTRSLTSKFAGYVFVKVAKFFTRRMRI